MSDSKEYSYITFATIAGSSSDLSKIDFSPWGLRCLHLDSQEFKEYMISINKPEDFSRNYEIIIEESKSNLYGDGEIADKDDLYIIFPLDLKKPPEEEDVYEAVNALLLIFPSNVMIKNSFHIQFVEDKYIWIAGNSNDDYSPRYGEGTKEYDYYLLYLDDYLPQINDFLSKFKQRISGLGYVQNAFSYYKSSFRINHDAMSFISLCICLESIVPDAEQLSFRFRRNIAVLCGESAESCEMISDNLKKLYAYRSKIVHFGMSTSGWNHFETYFNYAQLVASRVLIEMVLHNIPSITDLDKKICSLGYGDKTKISTGYESFDGNIITKTKLFSTTLPKV